MSEQIEEPKEIILTENQAIVLFELYKYSCAADRRDKYIVVKDYAPMAKLIHGNTGDVRRIVDFLALNDYIDIIYDRNGTIRNIRIKLSIHYRKVLRETYKHFLKIAENCINMTNPTGYDLEQLPDWYFQNTTFHDDLK